MLALVTSALVFPIVLAQLRRALETADLPDRASGNKLFRARTSIEGINALQAQMDAVYRKIEAAMPFGAGQIWRGAEAAQAR